MGRVYIVMKCKNLLLLLFLVAFLLLFSSTIVMAAPRDTLTFTYSSDSEELYGKDYLPLKFDGTETSIHFSKKKSPISSRYETYCIQSSKNWFDSGTKTYSYSGELNSKIAYVIGNGYPNKSLTGDANKDYFITGLTIFYFIDDSTISFSQFNFDFNNYANSTYGGHTSDVAREMAKLIAGANKYSSSDTTPSISLNKESSGFILSNDKKYYVSTRLLNNYQFNYNTFLIKKNKAINLI